MCIEHMVAIAGIDSGTSELFGRLKLSLLVSVVVLLIIVVV